MGDALMAYGDMALLYPTVEPYADGDIDGTGVWGDADQNGEVKMNDVVLIMQSLSNADKYGLEGTDSTHITKNGKYWGDVYEHNESAPDISVMDPADPRSSSSADSFTRS